MIRMGSGCVVDSHDQDFIIDVIEGLSIVSLKISKSHLSQVPESMELAKANTVSGRDPRSLWLGPDRWLLLSMDSTSEELQKMCSDSLGAINYLAIDYSAALFSISLCGTEASKILNSGTGIDFRSKYFVLNSCCRTRLGQVAAIIVADGLNKFSIHVDRSYEQYLRDWFVVTTDIYNSRFLAS